MLDSTPSFHHWFVLNQNDFNDLRSKIRFNRGIYYWFTTITGLERLGIPQTSKLFKFVHEGNDHFLVYIGIGPRSEKTQKQFIRQRIINCHLGNKISNSTFRFSIASCLGYNAISKLVGKKLKYSLDSIDEQTLSEFLRREFCIGINEHDTPWEIEVDEITKFTPPLNIQHNSNGWNIGSIKGTRQTLMKRAKSQQ